MLWNIIIIMIPMESVTLHCVCVTPCWQCQACSDYWWNSNVCNIYHSLKWPLLGWHAIYHPNSIYLSPASYICKLTGAKYGNILIYLHQTLYVHIRVNSNLIEILIIYIRQLYCLDWQKITYRGFSTSGKLYFKHSLQIWKKNTWITNPSTSLYIAVRDQQRSPWSHRAGGLMGSSGKWSPFISPFLTLPPCASYWTVNYAQCRHMLGSSKNTPLAYDGLLKQWIPFAPV